MTAALALGAVLVLITFAGRLAKSRGSWAKWTAKAWNGSAGEAAPLRLRATLALDTKRRLHLVEADGGSVLVLTGGASDTILTWRPTETQT